MIENSGAHRIRSIKIKWIRYSILSEILFATGFSVLMTVVLHRLFGIPGWSFFGVLGLVLFLLFSIRTPWKIRDITIAQVLNQEFPQLQESSGLLLKDYTTLNRLEQLQQQKTESVLQTLQAPLPVKGKLGRAGAVFTACLLAGFFLYRLPDHPDRDPKGTTTDRLKNQPAPEKRLPELAVVTLTVTPPRYTARPPREQQQFNLQLEEGSSVSWQLTTGQPARSLQLIFNDSLTLLMRSSDHSHWMLDKTFFNPGFYQVSIDGQLSELYKIETIRDQPPVIQIEKPEQYTTVEPGDPRQIPAIIQITDDYGIREASISATVSTGNGEAVKFKEQTIPLPGFGGKKQFRAVKFLSLDALGLQPGDELYFYIRATDVHQQEARSDIYIINMPDTTGLMSLEGLVSGINVKPEYFRSQRQIIIETEQLLKDKDSISPETFKNRSNNLGLDQKMLRLRYGKFLGEENESGEPGGNNRDELQDPANFNNAEKLREAFTDQHDKAEDATFFDPEIKKQLKATLTEMWNAELPLRVFKPREALPFEYKALRLLKDLQQKTRAYVAKTNSKTTPLDPEKRLTGDLSKINAPLLQKDVEQPDDPQTILRDALSVLEQLKAPQASGKNPGPVLRPANLVLNEKAIAEPSLFVAGVQAMKRILNGVETGTAIRLTDILAAEKSFQKILSTPIYQPGAGKQPPGQQLSAPYFKNLQGRQP